MFYEIQCTVSDNSNVMPFVSIFGGSLLFATTKNVPGFFRLLNTSGLLFYLSSHPPVEFATFLALLEL